MARLIDIRQQGDDFRIFIHLYRWDNPVASLLPQGYHLAAVLYDYKMRCIAIYKTEDGSMAAEDDHYRIDVSHEDSMKMSGNVYAELTLYKSDKTIVEHASDKVTLLSDSVMNNETLFEEIVTPAENGIEPLTEQEINELMN